MSSEEIDYLAIDDLLEIAAGVLPTVEVRDMGLLAAAAARPRSSAFGAEAYRSFPEKVAALLHSIARNHALVDGNKRLGWLAVVVFYGLNDVTLDAPDDDAYDLVISVAAADVEVREIAGTLARWH